MEDKDTKKTTLDKISNVCVIVAVLIAALYYILKALLQKGSNKMTTTDPQRKARDKWNRTHRDKQKIYNYRSHAKTFIISYADNKDIKELEKLLQERKRLLKDQANNG